ncbi:hypothetical protein ACSTS3_03695 [Aquimarina muelleri]|uniref:hypothetical protein n=1 Tax=Aquimarina muelleri TaxID=279356 RepID=UPI003F686E46
MIYKKHNMSIKYTKAMFKFFCTIVFFLGVQEIVFANDKEPITRKVDFKTIEEVNIGIANQLEFLINYNKKNVAEHKNAKNWYVYVVGDDTFNTNLFSGYLEDQLDLTDLGAENSPLNIEQLNNKLNEVNDKLLKEKKPLIYYGVANRKKAIIAPFFPFRGKYKVSSATTEQLKEYYNKAFDNSTENQNAAASETYETLKEFFKKNGESDQKSSALIRKTLSNAGTSGAIALSRYYFAILKGKKGDSANKANVSWWSFAHYLKGKEVPKIDADLLKAHHANLSSTSGDNNHKRINAWYNYLSGADLPESQFLKEILDGMINNSKCAGLSDTEGKSQKDKFIAAVNATNPDIDKIISTTRTLCSYVLEDIDYSYIIKAIKSIAKESINEKGEAVVLYLLHNIKSKDYGKLFNDFRGTDGKNELIETLLSEMDDRSINPDDKDNYTSFLGEILFICLQEDGAYLKAERAYLVDVLYEYYKKSAGDLVRPYYVVPALKKIISFNPDQIDNNFHDYLKGSNGDYQNLFKIIDLVTSNVNSNHIEEDLRVFGDSLGELFATRNDQEAFLKMLDISFFSTPNFLVLQEPQRKVIRALTFRMFSNIPENTNKIYDFLIAGEAPLDNFKKIIKNSNDNDYNLYSDIFYDGVTKILSKNNAVNIRIELAKWAINKDANVLSLTDIEEQLVVNIFKNISSKDDKKAIYNFLTYDEGDVTSGIKNFEYLKKCTDQGVLSSSSLMSAFISDYAKLLSEDGIGVVQDRLDLLQYALDKGDDSIFFNDTESLIGYIFDNLGTNFSDAETIIEALKKDQYLLFSKVWRILSSSGLTEIFNTDNRYATNFIEQLSGVMRIAYGDPNKELSKSIKDHMLVNVDYLSAKTSKIDKINIEKDTERYFPMARNGNFTDNVGNSKNDYEYSSDIILTANSASVKVNLAIQDESGNRKTIINTDKLGPLDFIIVEFIADTKITNQVEFKKGTVIAVPAMYLAWMSNSINTQQNAVVGRVMLDAVVIAGSVATFIPSGGTSAAFAAKFLAGAEIVFATTDAIIAVNEDELKDALGNDFIEGIETTNMIFGIATLPAALPGIVKITQKVGNVVTDLASAGMKFVDDIPSFKGYKIDIDGKVLLQSLEKIKAATPVKFNEEFKKVQNLLAQQRIKITNAPASARLLYDKTLALSKTFYFSSVKGLGRLPKKFKTEIVDKFLVIKVDGKVLAKVDEQGKLSDLRVLQEGEIAKLEDGADAIFENVKFIDEAGEQTRTITVVADGADTGIRTKQFVNKIQNTLDVVADGEDVFQIKHATGKEMGSIWLTNVENQVELTVTVVEETADKFIRYGIGKNVHNKLLSHIEDVLKSAGKGPVESIKTDWIAGPGLDGNLNALNKLIKESPKGSYSIEDLKRIIFETKAGQWKKELGFDNLEIINKTGQPGSFTSISIKFSKAVANTGKWSNFADVSKLDVAVLSKLDNWSEPLVSELNKSLGKYADLGGELTNSKLFDAVETILKYPENAWDALRDLKNADIVSETVSRIGKSSFFTEVIGKGRAFEKSVLENLVSGFSTKSGKAYDVVKNRLLSLNKNIDEYVLFSQLQLDVPGGKMIADQVLVKYKIIGNRTVIDDVIVLENKLKKTTSYTSRQISGWSEINTGKKLNVRSIESKDLINELNNKKILKQGDKLLISSVIRLDGGISGGFSNLQAIIEDLSKF